MKNLLFLLFGIYFGIVLIKSEAASWFRIHEKRLKIKSVNSEIINLSGKPFTKGNVIGGIFFGLGWAMTGTCPGPLYTLVADI